MHILSSLEDDRLESAHQQSQSCKHTGRSGSDDDDRLCRRHILIFIEDVFRHHLIRLIYLDPIAIEDIVACVDGTAHDAVFQLRFLLRRYSQSLYGSRKDFILGQFLSKFAGNFYLFHI